jgi:methionine-rich copper-binding protein CopC
MGTSSLGHAHSNLTSSIPEDGAQIKEATEIQLVFSAPVKLITMKLVNAAGVEVALDAVSLDMADSHNIVISDKLTPGMYVAAWRSIGGDSHVADGNLRFVVVD